MVERDIGFDLPCNVVNQIDARTTMIKNNNGRNGGNEIRNGREIGSQMKADSQSNEKYTAVKQYPVSA